MMRIPSGKRSAGVLVTMLITTVIYATPAVSAEKVAMVRDPVIFDVPVRGTPLKRVLDKWGQPNNVVPPVGEPPIARLRYDGFTVYLEWDLVIETIRDTDIPFIPVM